MGQITNPITKGITVNTIDRQSGPAAGGGAAGNNSIFLGALAGQNSTLSQLIVIGNQSGDAGLIDTANLNGTTILGAQSAQALTSAAAAPTAPSAMTIIGSGNIQQMVTADSTVIIGQGIAPTAHGAAFLQEDVIIGNGTLANMATSHLLTSVLIGFNVWPGAATFAGVNVVAIGANALAACTQSITDMVIIGENACQSVGSAGTSQQSVAIGSQVDMGANSIDNVVVGALAQSRTSNGGGNNVVIGAQALAGQSGAAELGNNTVIGAFARSPLSVGATGQNIIIGTQAGTTLPVASGGNFVIETNIGGSAQQAMIFGNIPTGNLVLGNSQDTVNRDFGGAAARNVLKLLNGTKGGVAPVGGGYFYVVGGNLHWVDTGGNDTQLSNATTGQIGVSFVNLTNNAGAQAATIGNGPTAGNPTKWAPFNDNGTIRNIPMW